MAEIWVVEDHEKIRATFLFQLGDAGYRTVGFSAAEPVRDELLADRQPPDLLLLDIRLGGMSGVELIRALSEAGRLPPTIVVSGEANISEAVEALRLGVHDFIEKPVGKVRLLRSVANALEHGDLKRQVADLRTRLDGGAPFLGESPPMWALKATIAKLAPTAGRVLIQGESGTGKEHIAAEIHRQSRRRAKPLVKINCAAIPVTLIESELFGHVRGAFTGARADKPGLFETAHGGTLFLDEIGDMDLGLQARLLRVLEDGLVRRIGDQRERKVDVRLVTATHRDLERLVGEGRFREDLYFRLNALRIVAPPLRERGADIDLLTAWFVARICEQNHMPLKRIEAEVLALFRRYHWPGNVRELRNLCERLVILGGDPLTVADVPSGLFRERAAVESGLVPVGLTTKCLPLRTFKAECEKEYIEAILRRTDWNFNEAARLLDIQRTYLYQKVKALDIERQR